MRKELEKRESENLSQWCERLAAEIYRRRQTVRELREILKNVSWVSYVIGVRTNNE